MSTESNTIETGEQLRLTEDERYRLLADAHRRAVLDVLEEATVPIHLHDLAVKVNERGNRSESESAEDVEGVEIALHHKHLPLMDDLGLVAYDSETNSVEAFAGLRSR